MITPTRLWPVLVLLVVVALSSESVHAEQPPAAASGEVTLLWWDGIVRVGPHPGTHGRDLVLPTRVNSGDAVHLEAGSRCFLLDTSRGFLLLEGRGVYRYNDGLWSGPEPARVVTLTWAGTAVPSGVPWTSSDVGSKKPFSDEHAVLIEPVETGVNTVNPTLKWAPPSRGQPVAVNLWRLESDGSLRLLESWRDVKGPVHRPWTELDRGRIYLWRVRMEGASAAEVVERLAWFYVLSDPANTFLKSALVALDELTEEPAVRLGIRASLLTLLGLLGEAEEGWRSVALARPDRGVAPRTARGLSRRRLDGPRVLAMPPLPFGLVRPPPLTDLPEVSPR